MAITNGTVTLTHVTLTGNEAGTDGGVAVAGGTTTIYAGLISGNSTTGNGDEIAQSGGAVSVSNSVLGDSARNDAAAFFGSVSFGPGTIRATDGGDEPTPLSAILSTALADSGGVGTLPGGENTKTHLLTEGCPAIDLVLSTACEVDTDQLGKTRPRGEGCDAGAVEYVDE